MISILKNDKEKNILNIEDWFHHSCSKPFLGLCIKSRKSMMKFTKCRAMHMGSDLRIFSIN